MNKQKLTVLLTALLGMCIDKNITTIGEFLERCRKQGLDTSKKVNISK